MTEKRTLSLEARLRKLEGQFTGIQQQVDNIEFDIKDIFDALGEKKKDGDVLTISMLVDFIKANKKPKKKKEEATEEKEASDDVSE